MSERIADIIRKKRDGFELSNEEINGFIEGYVNGEIADYFAAALMMAIYFQGMSRRETLALTLAMANSGDVVDLSSLGGITADKHSTGGVGDKTTLVVAPIVASCGIKMAKMSGRSLGHTGGTIDKLEAIPNFKTELTHAAFLDIVKNNGLCVAGQSGNLCPADKKLYSLRDVTATVESIPLIASSIMSKKLAAGAECIVLDVKCGSGAFMKTKDSAVELAKQMVDIGKGAGKKVMAVITDMNVPLGRMIGNSLEVIEAVETLNGNGPDDLMRVCIELATNILTLAGKGSRKECEALALKKITNGEALNKLAETVAAQGGNSKFIITPELFPSAPFFFSISSPEEGYVTFTDVEKIGDAAMHLGAGRAFKDDIIDSGAGIQLLKKNGDFVRKGEPIATLFSSDSQTFESVASLFLEGVIFVPEPFPKNELILERIF